VRTRTRVPPTKDGGPDKPIIDSQSPVKMPGIRWRSTGWAAAEWKWNGNYNANSSKTYPLQ